MARVFAVTVAKFVEFYECRGTMILGANGLVPVYKVLLEALVQFRVTKWNRSQKIVKVQDYNCEQ